MTAAFYEFVTRWEIDAPREMLYELLGTPVNYPVWMKSLNIQVIPISEGDENGVGREDIYHIRAFLPYSLTWKLKCIKARKPFEFLSVASGELKGTGKWTFQQKGTGTFVTFEWKVFANKPFLKRFSWLLRPVFKWNHDWVMQRWEKDLQRETARLKKEIKSIST